MTKRILLRTPKSPFDVVSPEQTALHNKIGSNIGNALFLSAAYKYLDTSDAEITPDGFAEHLLGPDEINERFDVYVIPLANGFRTTFMPFLSRMTKVIEGLKIPVVVLGGGLQARLPYNPRAVRPQDEVVTAFMRAVLDRSPKVGVRGEYTLDYLNRLGFRDVEVIGCPSMFQHGLDMKVTKRVPSLDRDSHISMSITPRITAMGPILASHLGRYPNLTYIGQEMNLLRLLLWGETYPQAEVPNALPVDPTHPIIREGKTRMWVDPWPWMDFLRTQHFAFGTRIHGNIAALLAGTPAFVFGHDTRTLELARYFAIPNRVMSEVPSDIDAAALYEEADYGALHAGHPERFARFFAYMEAHGLRHVYMDGEDPTAFDRRIDAIDFPGSVGLLDGSAIRRRQRQFLRGTKRAYLRVRGALPIPAR
jgi:hypothetical protein